ncbi:carboxymuconolactone decarboxylase family protein [Streptomyces inhibens]|uniref:carboxymuconolactone decarboxylase family protein n=1 Tax=Streptomyces inhibens TaxID=2293571 RepID=UPI0036B30DCA
MLLTGLNRPAELRLHIGGALRNGCTPEELAEVALQCAVYAGAPAGIDTMKMVRQETGRFYGEHGFVEDGA